MPAGFKIVNGATTVDKGIVIEDVTETATKGSQFVWVPVGTITKADGTTVTITLGRYDFDATTEKQEEKMRKKVLHLLLFVLILAGVYYYEIDNSVSVSAATDTYVARDPFYSLTDSSVNRMSSEHFQM